MSNYVRLEWAAMHSGQTVQGRAHFTTTVKVRPQTHSLTSVGSSLMARLPHQPRSRLLRVESSGTRQATSGGRAPSSLPRSKCRARHPRLRA